LDKIEYQTPKLNPGFFVMYVLSFRPSFEVVKEGRIFHFVSVYSRFEFATIAYNERSFFVDKGLAISNLGLIREI